MKKNKELSLEIGDLVVYPTYGVGEIEKFDSYDVDGLNQDFRGNTGLKQPQNPKLKFMGAQAFSATC